MRTVVVLAAPPSVPWRSGPHGARSMASGVDGVALVYGRWRRRVHGVSVEYDVSVEYGGCYEAVVACAPKEQ